MTGWRRVGERSADPPAGPAGIRHPLRRSPAPDRAAPKRPECARPFRRSAWSKEDESNVAFNGWKQVSVRCLKLLADEDVVAVLPEHLHPLAIRFAGPARNAVVAAADVVIAFRNDLAHGFVGFGPDQAERLGAVAAAADELSRLLVVYAEAGMVVVEGHERLRHSARLRLRHLVGDNELTEVTEEEVGLAAAATAVHGEVHARTGSGLSLLPLDPWIIHRPGPEGGAATVWLFDGWRKNVPRYKFPLRPGQTLEATDLLPRLLEVRSGHAP